MAGGLGTRLRSVVTDLPKPMAPVGDKPFLVYILDYLNRQHVNKAIISTGYMHDKIEHYFGYRYRELDLVYSVENEPLGTGGAIKKALKQTTESEVLILNGDTFFDINLKELIDKHKYTDADLTLALKPMNDFDRYGEVVLSDDRVVNFSEKKFTRNGYINGGVYFAKSDLFSTMMISSKFSFEIDFMQKNLTQLKICGYISNAFFIDIGIPEDYYRVQSELTHLYEK